MKIAECPYNDKKCGGHAQCTKCETRRKLVGFLKSKIRKHYYSLSAEDAAWIASADIVKWYNIGWITYSEKGELADFNTDLYLKSAETL